MQASEIVAALRANEAGAPAQLFDAYGEQLIAHCWQLLRSEDATLIAVRDTMIVAQAHAGRLRDPELIEPWLLALARGECERRARAAAGHAAKTPGAGDARDAPPAPATMRDEILMCLTDPWQARYRAVAAARVAAPDGSGFPASAAASRAVRAPRWHRAALRVAPRDATGLPAGAARQARWRPRGRHLHLGGGLITVGVASIAAVILLAAGVSLRGAAAPAASASSAAAQAGPAHVNSARPQVRPVAARSPVPSPQLGTPGQSTTGQKQRVLYDISSQPGPSGRIQSGSRPGGHGGHAPPVLQGLPPVPAPTTSAPSSTPAPSNRLPWEQPPNRHWTPRWSPPATGGGTSSAATPTPSPWSPAPWPTRPERKRWLRQWATAPGSTAPSPTGTMTVAVSPDPATPQAPSVAASPAPGPGSPGAPAAWGHPGRSWRHGP